MPWPFRRPSRQRGESGPDGTPERPARPVTAADLAPAPPRPAVGGWATLPPLAPIAPTRAPTVSSVGGLGHGIAHGRSVVGPRRPAVPPPIVLPPPSAAATRRDLRPVHGGGDGSAAAGAAVPRVLPVRSGPVPTGGSYTHLTVDPDRFETPPFEDDGALPPADVGGTAAEELPPPIFSALLAAQTGKELSELRPDWTGPVPGPVDGDVAPPAGVRRRRSLGETRRLGLGPPLAEPAADDVRGEEPPSVAEPLSVTAPVGDDGPSPAGPSEADPTPAEQPTASALASAAPWYLSTTTPEAARLERVPATVVADVRSILGVDVGETEVHRGIDVDTEARRLSARAFFRSGQVYVPDAAGSLDSPTGRGLVAHELVHVAQHRSGDSDVDPASPAGARLEAEARAVERYARGEDGAPLALPRRFLPATDGAPRPDAGGHVREVTERLAPRPERVADQPRGERPLGPGPRAVWRAEVDEGRADTELQSALRDDVEATTRWIQRRQTADDAERARLDAEEQERHRRFIDEYGHRLGQIEGSSAAAGGPHPGGGGAADFEPRPVAAHEAFGNMFAEQGGVRRALDPGIAGFVGQFGRRPAAERAGIERRMETYGLVAGPRRSGESDAEHATRMEHVATFQREQGARAGDPATGPGHGLTPPRTASGTPTSTPPTTASAARPTTPTAEGATAALTTSTVRPATPAGTTPAPTTGAPSAPATGATPATSQRRTPSTRGQDFEPAPLAAHEAFGNMLTDRGGLWRALDPGIVPFAGQFGRRSAMERDAIDERMDDYAAIAGPRVSGESDRDYAIREERIEGFQRAQGVRAGDPAGSAVVGGATPAGPGSSAAASRAADGAPAAPESPATAAVAPAGEHALGGTEAAPAATAIGQHTAGALQDVAAAHGRPGAAGAEDVIGRLDIHDLEELSNLLYNRFRTRLRRELLIDRERTGLLTDFR